MCCLSIVELIRSGRCSATLTAWLNSNIDVVPRDDLVTEARLAVKWRASTMKYGSIKMPSTVLRVCLLIIASSCYALEQITFLRHGCTFMNEYLGGADGGKAFGSKDFTDVFDDPKRLDLYRDSPLSSYGRRQVQQLNALPAHDLVVVSPLQRALQTYDRGVRPQHPKVPVIALPLAAERLYLISDVGTEKDKLYQQYQHVSFEFVPDGKWWYQPSDAYGEWRPTGQGQRYACPGEPMAAFERRMQALTEWLLQRPEDHILLVCHHGVIEALIDEDFCNCEFKTVPANELMVL